jgi:hypothetical protein
MIFLLKPMPPRARGRNVGNVGKGGQREVLLLGTSLALDVTNEAGAVETGSKYVQRRFVCAYIPGWYLYVVEGGTCTLTSTFVVSS